ncbi:MAG: RAD55 family ATPase, partial [Candidatus Anstonellaceae archaeon]
KNEVFENVKDANNHEGFYPEEEKVPSGVPGFDELCGGGFEKNSANLIIGPSGSGKTIFLSQYIYTGAVFYDEPGIIVNLDQKKEVVFKYLEKFNWFFFNLEKKGLVTFINLKPHELKKLIEEGGGLIWDSAMEIGAKRIAFDSLSSFSSYFPSKYELRESVINLFELTKKWRCTALFSYHNLSFSSIKMEVSLDVLADSFISLYNIRKDNLRIRGIEIIKMRGCNHVSKIVPFEIIEHEGIAVYPSENIFEKI